MAYSTPPTFVTGQIPTPGQMNILADDVIWLHGQATRPQPFGHRAKVQTLVDQSETVFAYSWGVKKVNQDQLDIRGRIYNERSGGTSVVVKAYLMCKQGAGRTNPVWPTDATLLFTETQTDLGTTQINQTYDLTDIADENERPATNEMYQIWFTFDTSDGGGGLSSYAEIHHVWEGYRTLATYATPYTPTDGNTPTAANLNTYRSAIYDLAIESLAPVTGWRLVEYDQYGSHDVAETTIGTAWGQHRDGCDSLYVNCDVTLSGKQNGAQARVNIYTLQTDGTETLVSAATLVRTNNGGTSTYGQSFDISGVGLAANERYAVVVKFQTTGTNDKVDGSCKVYNAYEHGDGPAAYVEPGEWAAQQYTYGTTAGQTTRLDILRTDLMALAGDAGAGYVRANAATVYRNYHTLTLYNTENMGAQRERMQFVRMEGFNTLRYRVLNATLYWGNTEEPDSQRLQDLTDTVSPYDTKAESLQYRVLDLAALRSLAPGMEFWIEVGERATDAPLPEIQLAVVDV